MNEPREPGRLDTTHLDHLTAMRLVDGEPIAARAQQHAKTCPVCTTLVESFRMEAMSFSMALSLDDEEIAFLAGAGLPERVVSFAGSPVAGHGVPHIVWTRRAGSTFLAIAAASLVAAAGLVISAPWLAAVWDVAQRAGFISAALQVLGGWLLYALSALVSIFDTALSSPWNDAPALLLGIASVVVAAAAWAVPAPGKGAAYPVASAA